MLRIPQLCFLAIFAVMLFAFVADAGPRRAQCLDGSCQMSAVQSVQAVQVQPNKEHVTVYPSYTFMREAEQVGFYDAMYKDFHERQGVSSACSNGSCNQQSTVGNTSSERRHPLRTLISIGIGKRCRR